MVARDRILIAYTYGDRIRLIRTSGRNGDFQTKFMKIQNCCEYKRLTLFQFFILFLVSFGTVWKYLTLKAKVLKS